MDGLSTFFKIGAIKAGAPKDIVERFNGAGKHRIIGIYKDEIKTWINAGWPDMQTLEDNIGRELLAKYHVHCDDDFRDGGDSDSYIVGGQGNGTLTFSKHRIAVVYAIDDAEVLVEASDWATVFVHVHDRAHVTVEQHGTGKVTVKSHSEECDVLTTGNVKYIDGVANGTAEYYTPTDEERRAMMEKYAEKSGKHLADTE